MLKSGLAIGLLLALLSACSVTEYSHVNKASISSSDSSDDNDASANDPPSSDSASTLTSDTNTLAGKVLWNNSPSLSSTLVSSCALTTIGDVMCWGGVTTDGIYVDSRDHVSTKVAGISNAVQVSSGDDYSCAVTAGGNVACWPHRGRATYLNEGSSRFANIVQVSVHFEGKAACALTTRGSVKCWLSEDLIKNGAILQRAAQPLDILDRNGNILSGIAQVVVGRVLDSLEHCFLTAAGSVKCWNSVFQGNNRLVYHPNGSLVRDGIEFYDGVAHTNGSPLTNIVQIHAGVVHYCALTSPATGGKVMCWGSNYYGHLGNGKFTKGYDNSNASEVVTGGGSHLQGIASIAAGYNSTCAIAKDGAAWCWGKGKWCSLPVLGKQCSSIDESFPVAKRISNPPSAGGFSNISIGEDYSCGLAKSSGASAAVYCWGLNFGQCGVNPTKGIDYTNTYPHLDIRLPVPGLVVPHRRAKFGCNSSACVLKVGS